MEPGQPQVWEAVAGYAAAVAPSLVVVPADDGMDKKTNQFLARRRRRRERYRRRDREGGPEARW